MSYFFESREQLPTLQRALPLSWKATELDGSSVDTQGVTFSFPVYHKLVPEETYHEAVTGIVSPFRKNFYPDRVDDEFALEDITPEFGGFSLILINMRWPVPNDINQKLMEMSGHIADVMASSAPLKEIELSQ
jgi:hypothetical protein